MGGHPGRVGGLVVLAFLCACSLPDSYHLGTSYGISEFDRPINDFDTAAVYVGVSWHPGERERHQESLDATRRLEIATVTGKVQPMPVQDAVAADATDEHITDYIPPPPKTREEAWSLLIYGAFLLLLAVAARIGVVAWKKYKKPKETEK